MHLWGSLPIWCVKGMLDVFYVVTTMPVFIVIKEHVTQCKSVIHQRITNGLTIEVFCREEYDSIYRCFWSFHGICWLWRKTQSIISWKLSHQFCWSLSAPCFVCNEQPARLFSRIFGHVSHRSEWQLVKIDFRSIFNRRCTEADYQTWHLHNQVCSMPAQKWMPAQK